MTLLDAFPLVAFLGGKPAAQQVRVLLATEDCAVTTINLAETLDVCRRLYGLSVQRAMEVLSPLLAKRLGTLPLDVALARRAAEIRSDHYHRVARPISLADAVLIAAASEADRIATADPDVLAVAQERGIGTVALVPEG